MGEHFDSPGFVNINLKSDSRSIGSAFLSKTSTEFPEKESMENVNKEFKSLGLSPEVLANLESLGYLEMTPIQAQALPFILDNKDLIGQANTGSGKTAAFGLGILAKLDVAHHQPQALVLRKIVSEVSQYANVISLKCNNGFFK